MTFGHSPTSGNKCGSHSQMNITDLFCGICSDNQCNDCSNPICGYTSGINLKNARLIANSCTKLSVIMLDSGTSLACTPLEDDFEKLTLIKGDEKVIKGIAKGLIIKGLGLVPYALKANDGSDIVLLTKSYYVPEMPQRLVFPQSCCIIQGNPVKFSTFSSYQNKPGFESLEIYPKSANWYKLPPLQSRHNCPSGAKTSIRSQDKYMEIKKGDLFPGDKVSVDHYQSAVPGRDYKSRVSPPPQEMFNGGSIFVDHASGCIFIHHQVSLTAVESIKAKLVLER